jgi:Zn-dependent M28 family amino/carboxypeptidase
MPSPRDPRSALLPLRFPDDCRLGERLERHVTVLASEIGERHVGRGGALAAAAKHIATELLDAGCEIVGQRFEVAGRDVHNIAAEQAGHGRPEEIVVIGAHYDSTPGCPGANDNASGVAALLEIARACRPHAFARTIRWVAFVNEEPPFFRTPAMGSLLYARNCLAAGDRIVGMCALETIGYYTNDPHTQRYPTFPISWCHPDTGNFVAFVSNRRSRRWLNEAATAFRASTDFPLETAALPAWIPGVGWSDHWAFWQAGYAALMVTDTAPYRYAHYHKSSDTPDKLDYAAFARVTAGLIGMVQRLNEVI